MINARMIRRVTPALLAAIAAGSIVGCEWNEQFRAEKTLTQVTSHVEDGHLTLKTHNGSIEVVGSPDATEVEIIATIKCSGSTQQEADDRLAAADIEVLRSTDGTLSIRPIFPVERRSNDGASFVVTIPSTDGATLSSSNGRITVTGIGGTLIADTSNGRIEVAHHDGEVEADTSNGRIIAKHVTGNVHGDTSNGTVTYENIDGDMIADTSNGAIEITLRPGQSGTLNADTSNGAIVLTVEEGFHGHVKMSTSNGSISVSDPHDRCISKTIQKRNGDMVIGDGSGADHSLSTSNGSISVIIN